MKTLNPSGAVHAFSESISQLHNTTFLPVLSEQQQQQSLPTLQQHEHEEVSVDVDLESKTAIGQRGVSSLLCTIGLLCHMLPELRLWRLLLADVSSNKDETVDLVCICLYQSSLSTYANMKI